MANIKKPTKKVSRIVADKITPSEQKSPFFLSNLKMPTLGNKVDFNKIKSDKRVYLAILIIGLLLLFSFKKSWFIAATVNGEPISSLELFSRMNQQFRSQTLNQLINEKIVLNEAKKNKVSVSPAEVNNRIAQLEKNVGGTQVLDNLLSQQGQTRDSLKNQIRVQLIIEKLYDKEATFSAQELDQFIAQNQNQLQSTDSAKQKEEATQLLKQQKVSKIFGEKFQQLKQFASVKIF